METIEIWERIYDNPTNPDGTEKPNKLLGEFEIIQSIHDDMYSSMLTGKMVGTDDIYLIEEFEVSYQNGGSRFEITKLENLQTKINS